MQKLETFGRLPGKERENCYDVVTFIMKSVGRAHFFQKDIKIVHQNMNVEGYVKPPMNSLVLSKDK